ncbi:hypothetical protein PsW64_03338 [Pseudovibrio sp. W64]|uniref:hypothetical protein n=1 Tax=Pseudovibrio sp. W64 TaxID=1735583 RepID=UPI0007AED24C|nr:hypothetical protein [Pseudovibrio sp. W64]KZK78994.1 hypothetical protein PsW64_03338 [Pseudovibrio sp. W64]
MELLPLRPLSTAGSSTGVATDFTEGNQGDNKCSYADYVEKQFWEYVAQIELVYMLATDEETRELLVEAIKKSAREGAIYTLNSYGQYLASRSAATQFRDLADLYFPNIEEKVARGHVDNDTYNAYLDHLARANKIEREGRQAKNDADAFVKDAADKFYKELTQRLEECGWFYASATLATDAALIAAEALATAGIGVAALKGLRLSANIVTKGAKKAGEKAIPVAVAAQIHLQSGAVVTKTFSIAHLKGRYGTPMEHHAGTLAKEKNRGRSDGDDEKDEIEQSGKDTRPKTKKTTRTRGNNTNEIEYDAETGRPIRAKGVLKAC